jgi:hypothetical protein
MIGELIAAGFLIGNYVYHRWIEDQPPKQNPGEGIKIPTSSEGSAVPLIYGRIRVKAPIMAWWGTAQVHPGSDVGSSSPFVYGVDIFFVLGIPFENGNAHVLAMWAGERKLGEGPPGLGSRTGDGGRETPVPMDTSALPGDGGFVGGQVEMLNGNPGQTLVDGSLASTTWAADRMILYGVPPQQIPGYRGYLSFFLFNGSSVAWYIGPNPQPDSYSFEATSYPTTSFGDSGVNNTIGDDANPVRVIYDIMTATLGKLGLSSTLIDTASFVAAALTVQDEAHGFSRVWDQTTDAGEYVNEILKQIDGVMFEDPVTGTVKIKLIRADYFIDDIASIDPSNCSAIENFAAAGMTDVTNKVRLVYTNRANEYRDGSGLAINQANALGQDGEVREVVLQMPGVCTQELADNLAGRELTYRCRPLMKCRAIVNRSLYLETQGNAVLLTWPEANISRMVFRVANVTRGTLEDGKIALDLIQDAFYNWRRSPPVDLGPITGFPVAGFA